MKIFEIELMEVFLPTRSGNINSNIRPCRPQGKKSNRAEERRSPEQKNE